MYKYYSVIRPISIGTIPNCTIREVVNFNQRQYVEEIMRQAWGYFLTQMRSRKKNFRRIVLSPRMLPYPNGSLSQKRSLSFQRKPGMIWNLKISCPQ